MIEHQSVPGCAEEYGDPLVQSGGRWQNLRVTAGSVPAHKSKETQAWLQKEFTTLYSSLTDPLPEPAGLLRLVIC